MKYGAGVGQLQKATGSANVSSIIHEYADATLLGATVKCDAASAGEVGTNFIYFRLQIEDGIVMNCLGGPD